MEGTFFSLEKALCLSREIHRITKLFSKKIDLQFEIDLTGEGEALLNPEMVDILDIIMGLNNNVTCFLVTSGVNSESIQEINSMVKLALRPYAKRINFCLSFNEFEKKFPERLICSLDLLFQNNVPEATVKVCIPFYYRKVVSSFVELIFGHFSKWARKKHPLLSDREIFIQSVKENEFLEPLHRSYRLDMNKKKTVKKSVKKGFVNIRTPSREEIFSLGEWLSINCRETIEFETEHGLRKITFSPHFLKKLGRAEKLSSEFLIKEQNQLCGYLGEDYPPLHLGADGYYYPYGLCNKFKIGHIEDNLEVILWRHRNLKKILHRAIIADTNMSRSFCSICIEAFEQYKARHNSTL